MDPRSEALRLLEESLAENEASKGTLLTVVQKLARAATLLQNADVQKWCAIQLGDPQYTKSLKNLIKAAEEKDPAKRDAEIARVKAELENIGLTQAIHYTQEELSVKFYESGGGYNNIGFVEEQYADLVRTKSGNDGTYYKTNLITNLTYVRRRAHELASDLLNQLRFLGTSSNCFDILRIVVDDKLLDLNPTLAEQLMLAFKGVSSSGNEEWSQALTTCRRLLEGVADAVYPANSDPVAGRVLTQAQYINRIWAFMDKAIESESNKALAKAHVDFLGAWMEKTNKIANKGVHAEVGQLEAVKAVFHTYLVMADILDYLKPSIKPKAKPNINEASMDELEALLNVSRSVAKEIVKARVAHGKLDANILKSIQGVGAKVMQKALAGFSF